MENAIAGIAESIGSVLKKLFIPTHSPFDEIKEMLNDKIPIVFQLGDFLNNFFDVIGGYDYTDYEPTIDIRLDGLYGLEGDFEIINFTWFDEYRDIVHFVISAFMWLGFAVLTYRSIPKMIGGI